MKQTCKLCGQPIELKGNQSGNAHPDCYWKWMHEAFTDRIQPTAKK